MPARRRPAKHPLPGRVVAITGAGRGIGLRTAQLLLERGAKVALGDLDEGLVQEAAASSPAAAAFALDVTDRDSFRRFLDGAAATLGPVDVLVNNAGIMPIGPFLDESPEVTRRQVDVNVHGVIDGMKLALPAMLARGSGQIVNLGSMASLVGLPGEAVYCGTKHAVLGLSEAVRSEIRGSGVDITVVMPNLAATDLGAGMSSSRATKLLTADDVAERIVGAIERPRFEVPITLDAGLWLKTRRLLPARVRDVTDRAFAMDKVATDVKTAERAAYERRIAAEAEENAPVPGR
jgi:NADP-dependent 3-hydroxy acid dehydrogenase YdfG